MGLGKGMEHANHTLNCTCNLDLKRDGYFWCVESLDNENCFLVSWIWRLAATLHASGFSSVETLNCRQLYNILCLFPAVTLVIMLHLDNCCRTLHKLRTYGTKHLPENVQVDSTGTSNWAVYHLPCESFHNDCQSRLTQALPEVVQMIWWSHQFAVRLQWCTYATSCVLFLRTHKTPLCNPHKSQFPEQFSIFDIENFLVFRGDWPKTYCSIQEYFLVCVLYM